MTQFISTFATTGSVKPDLNSDRWGSWLRRLVIVVAFAMLLYIAVSMWIGFPQIKEAADNFPVRTHLPGIIGLVTLGWLIRGVRWHFFIRFLRLPIPLLPSMLAFLASFALTATPGKSGEVIKSGFIHSRYEVPISKTAGVLLVERLGDLVSVIMLASLGLANLGNMRIFFVISVFLVSSIPILLMTERIHEPLIRTLALAIRTDMLSEGLRRLMVTGRELLRPTPMITGMSLSIIAWTLESVSFHIVLKGFGLDVPLLTALSVYGTSTVIGAISMLPGGVGGVESTQLVLLNTAGVAPFNGVPAVLLTRFTTLWFVSFAGFGFIGIWWLIFGHAKKDKQKQH